MTSTAPGTGTWLRLLRAPLHALLLIALTALVTACGGSDADLPPPTGPSLTQPADQSTTVGANATFTISVAGGAAATFQWQRLNGATWTDVPGANNAALLITGATLADNGTQYRAMVTVAGSMLISNPATLTVTAAAVAPTITLQPANVAVVEAASASFTVTASGTAPLTYHWQRLDDASWNVVAGATGASYTTPATRTSDNGAQFRVVITNAQGSVTSNPATLTVTAAATAPAITTQPANQSVTEPASASFNVAASGTGPLAYQWQRFVSSAWSNISGATSATYATPATVRAADNGAQFRVVITNAVGSVTSNAATLTVLAPVTAKSWRASQLIETGTGNVGNEASLAIDGSGNAFVVWSQESGGSGSLSNIWANRYAPGAAWGTAQLIETNDTADAQRAPRIAADAAGNAIAVWVQSSNGSPSVWANRYTAGSGWGTAELIETTNVGPANTANIAMDSSGNALAVWSHRTSTRYNLWANRYTVGSGWGTPELIETDEAGDAAQISEPQVAFDGTGHALAVWEQSDGTRTNLWANRYTRGSGWGTAQLIETDNAGNARTPSLAVDAAGNALAVWDQSDGTLRNIWANRYTAGSGWGTAQLIETGGAGAGATEPYVAIDNNGNGLAVWTQRDAANVRTLEYSRYTPGAGWGTVSTVATSALRGGPSSPRIAFDNNGDALAVWGSNDGTNSTIGVGRYTLAGGLVQSGGFANGGSSAQAVLPRIAVDANGNAVVVWLQNTAVAGNSAPFSVWAVRFE